MCSPGGVPPVQLSHLQKKFFEVKEKLKRKKQYKEIKDLKYKCTNKKIRRNRHTSQLLHTLKQRGDLCFGTSCRMSDKGYVSAY
jgi:hypothetical protein